MRLPHFCIIFFNPQKIRFSTIFELRADDTEAIVLKPKTGEMSSSKLVQIARYVAANGHVSIRVYRVGISLY